MFSDTLYDEGVTMEEPFYKWDPSKYLAGASGQTHCLQIHHTVLHFALRGLGRIGKQLKARVPPSVWELYYNTTRGKRLKHLLSVMKFFLNKKPPNYLDKKKKE